LVLVWFVSAAVAVCGAGAFRADYPIDSITQGEGTRLTGSTTSEQVGNSVSGGGDVDGDGLMDFVVGADYATSLSGGGAS
jgi:hypothetical protein